MEVLLRNKGRKMRERYNGDCFASIHRIRIRTKYILQLKLSLLQNAINIPNEDNGNGNQFL